jgi:hypothetical protein
VRELCGVLGALQRHGDRLLQRLALGGVGRPGLGCHAALHEVQAADDHGQKVVEVVRDAAGELADRLHLLRLPEQRLRFQALCAFGLQVRSAFEHPLLQLGVELLQGVGRGAPVGHVRIHAEHAVGARMVAMDLRPARERAHAAFAVGDAEFGVEAALAAQGGLEVGIEARPILRVHGAREAGDVGLQLARVDPPALEGGTDEGDLVGPHVPIPQSDTAGLLRQAKPALAFAERAGALGHPRFQPLVRFPEPAVGSPGGERHQHGERGGSEERGRDHRQQAVSQAGGLTLPAGKQFRLFLVEGREVGPNLVHELLAFFRADGRFRRIRLAGLYQGDVASSELQFGCDLVLEIGEPRLLARIVAS